VQVTIFKDGKNIAVVNAVDYVGLQALQVAASPIALYSRVLSLRYCFIP
jgi:hypothetical protein